MQRFGLDQYPHVPKPVLILCIKGGLGNQLFQYAAARALADRVGAELRIDWWTGFARDWRYRRRPELHGFAVRGATASWVDRWPFLVAELSRLVSAGRLGADSVVGSGLLLRERSTRFLRDIHGAQWNGRAWMDGYWQSYRYFEDQPAVVDELCPPSPTRASVRELGLRMAQEDSVALGLRLYEEARSAAAHSRDGRVKSAQEIREALNALVNTKSCFKVYVFCSHRAPIIDQLKLPPGTELVIPERGFSCPVESLWLMTNCRHHILTNSTLYWWGAFLGQWRQRNRQGTVFAADNFLNPDSVLPTWKTF